MYSRNRLLLWDCDGRSYSYYIEVSTNQQHWTVVADKTKEACRSWQILTFEKRPITFIKIVGTHNTANEVFQSFYDAFFMYSIHILAHVMIQYDISFICSDMSTNSHNHVLIIPSNVLSSPYLICCEVLTPCAFLYIFSLSRCFTVYILNALLILLPL